MRCVITQCFSLCVPYVPNNRHWSETESIFCRGLRGDRFMWNTTNRQDRSACSIWYLFPHGKIFFFLFSLFSQDLQSDFPFGIIHDYAQKTAIFFIGIHFSRHESGRSPFGDLFDTAGLRRVCCCFGRDAVALSDSNSGLVYHAKSLASGSFAGKRSGCFGVYAAGFGNPCQAMVRVSQNERHRSVVSRTVQGLCGGRQRISSNGFTVCRTESTSSQPGGTCGPMALVKFASPIGASGHIQCEPAAINFTADCVVGQLGRICLVTSNGKRTGKIWTCEDKKECGDRSPVWRGGLVKKNGQTFGSCIIDHPKRPTKKEKGPRIIKLPILPIPNTLCMSRQKLLPVPGPFSPGSFFFFSFDMPSL